jgi:hypothetical protein
MIKIYTRITFEWAGTRYAIDHSRSVWKYYDGVVNLCCGASDSQKQIGASQQTFMTQVQSQAGAVFGNSSSVFNDLMKTFAPTVAAGPNQQGFSAAENSNLNSQAITQTGQAYKNAKAAVGNAQSSVNGGNVSLPSGAQIGQDVNLASSAANQTANELGQITQQNYATGRQNYELAAAGLSGATNTFNTASGMDNSANSAGEAAAKTANDISTQNQSWMQAVAGGLGAVAGDVATGGMANLGKGVGFFGQNANAPSN